MLQRMFAYKVKQQKKMLNILIFFSVHYTFCTSTFSHNYLRRWYFCNGAKNIWGANYLPPKKVLFYYFRLQKKTKSILLGCSGQLKNMLWCALSEWHRYFTIFFAEPLQMTTTTLTPVLWFNLTYYNSFISLKGKKKSRQPTSLSTVNNSLSDM